MSYRVTSINTVDANSDNNIVLAVTDCTTDTPATGETLIGTAGADIEFGAPPTANDISDYFGVADSAAGSTTLVGSTYISQYIDNRSGTDSLVKSTNYGSTNVGGDGIAYGGSGTARVYVQIDIPANKKAVMEFHVHPRFSTSSGSSQLQWVAGVTGGVTENMTVTGNHSYCASNSPSRSFYAIAVNNDATNPQLVWPKIQAQTNQRIGSFVANTQTIISFTVS